MSKNDHPQEKKKGFPLFKLALGAALAAGAGYYATHQEEVNREAKKRIEVLAKLFKENRPMVEKKVAKVWGKVSTEGIAVYLDLRGQLLHALENENLKKNGKMVKAQYDKLVEDVLKKARKSGILTPAIEARLAEVFKTDWKDVSKVLIDLLMTGAQKTAKIVRKARVAGKARAVKRNVKAAAKVTKKAGKKVAAKLISKKPAAKNKGAKNGRKK
jgi:hypothetical protein